MHIAAGVSREGEIRSSSVVAPETIDLFTEFAHLGLCHQDRTTNLAEPFDVAGLVIVGCS